VSMLIRLLRLVLVSRPVGSVSLLDVIVACFGARVRL
jgi:hypothetical protein